jgi:hypothetical protein
MNGHRNVACQSRLRATSLRYEIAVLVHTAGQSADIKSCLLLLLLLLGLLLLRWRECHAHKKRRLIHTVVLVAVRAPDYQYHATGKPDPVKQQQKKPTYLNIASAPGDSIIGNGSSTGNLNHLLTKHLKISPCATCP